jgi:small subunit ribosomal protein S17
MNSKELTQESRPKRREKSGTVVKVSDEKSVSVLVETLRRHALYKKVLRVSKKYLVHVELGTSGINVGDKVVIMSCRPVSKRKSWRLIQTAKEAVKQGNG